MFGFTRKTRKAIAHDLLNTAMEAGSTIAENNFFHLTLTTRSHDRFAIGAQIFANLTCQKFLVCGPDAGKTLEVCSLMDQRHISLLSTFTGQSASASERWPNPVPIRQLVVWSEELAALAENLDLPAGRAIFEVNLPLTELLRELYNVRLARTIGDDLEATIQALQKPASMASLLPGARTLILQTTADAQRASDENTVFEFAVSLSPLYLGLAEAAKAARPHIASSTV